MPIFPFSLMLHLVFTRSLRSLVSQRGGFLWLQNSRGPAQKNLNNFEPTTMTRPGIFLWAVLTLLLVLGSVDAFSARRRASNRRLSSSRPVVEAQPFLRKFAKDMLVFPSSYGPILFLGTSQSSVLNSFFRAGISRDNVKWHR
jgi:hypothetical protein